MRRTLGMGLVGLCLLAWFAGVPGFARSSSRRPGW